MWHPNESFSSLYSLHTPAKVNLALPHLPTHPWLEVLSYPLIILQGLVQASSRKSSQMPPDNSVNG